MSNQKMKSVKSAASSIYLIISAIAVGCTLFGFTVGDIWSKLDNWLAKTGWILFMASLLIIPLIALYQKNQSAQITSDENASLNSQIDSLKLETGQLTSANSTLVDNYDKLKLEKSKVELILNGIRDQKDLALLDDLLFGWYDGDDFHTYMKQYIVFDRVSFSYVEQMQVRERRWNVSTLRPTNGFLAEKFQEVQKTMEAFISLTGQYLSHPDPSPGASVEDWDNSRKFLQYDEYYREDYLRKEPVSDALHAALEEFVNSLDALYLARRNMEIGCG